ncbi:uncharacterized protein LOC135393848 isoform X2 [Ornithodoros turicata]|uniref:uncharacterized protein LOC135393848 isoform X2 n=1 Tax=Ornithodoros turicata TaxID=34597 RepID=UPI00313A3705
MSDEDSHFTHCHSILKEILQDDDDDDQVVLKESTQKRELAEGVQALQDKEVEPSCDQTSDTPSMNQQCCCGVKDRVDFENGDCVRDDLTGVCVYTGGRFPCLHIRLTNLESHRTYFVALDFTLLGNTSPGEQALLDYTEPYFVPRPNHLAGWHWNGNALYFNLNSIANGGLQESYATLKMACEYEPTLRVIPWSSDVCIDPLPLMRFRLKHTAFLVVSLHCEARENKNNLVREFLLVRTSEMTRGPSECCRSPPSSSSEPPFSPKFMQPFLQNSTCSNDRRRVFTPADLPQLRQPARQADAMPPNSTALRFPTARVPCKENQANIVKAPQNHHPLKSGIWQHTPWSNGTNGHSTVSSNGQTEAPALTAFFRSLQNCAPPRFVTDQKPKVVLPKESRPTLPPFSRHQQQNLAQEWQQRGANLIPRSAYDIFLNGYLQWVAMTRSNLSLRQLEAEQQAKTESEPSLPSPSGSPEAPEQTDNAKTAFSYHCGTYYYTPYWNTAAQSVQFT